MLRRSVPLVAVPLLVLTALPATADFRLERDLPLEPGGRLVVEAEGGSVRVTGRARSGASVVVTSRRSDVEDDYDLSFESAPGEVRVRAERRGGFLSGWFAWRGDGLALEIQVPRSTDVDVETSGGRIEASDLAGDFRLETSGGTIVLERLEGDVDAHTSGGAIRATEVDGDARLDTSGGSITVEEVSGRLVAATSGGAVNISEVGGDVEARTSGGGIEVRGARGRVAARTSGGPVAVEFAPGNARGGDLSSSGGGVTAYVDPEVGLEIDAESSGGSVHCDLPITVRGSVERTTLRGTLNSGGARLVLRTSGGGVRIRAR